MAKVSEAERDALRRAAEAAAPIIRQLQQERADLDARIATLQAIVDAPETISGRRARSMSDDGVKRPRKTGYGQVSQWIPAALAGGVKLTETELRERIREQHGVECPRGTVYSTLRRGQKAGLYTRDEQKRWRLLK